MSAEQVRAVFVRMWGGGGVGSGGTPSNEERKNQEAKMRGLKEGTEQGERVCTPLWSMSSFLIYISDRSQISAADRPAVSVQGRM